MTLSANTRNWPLATGRTLLALYFLVPGILKFMAFDMHIGLMAHHGVPMPAPLLIIAGGASIIGAVLLISNRHVRLTAFGFALYIVLVNVLLHDFWNFDGIEGQHEMQNFIKNIGILAGTLILAGTSAKRRLTLGDFAKSDSAFL